MQTTPVSTYAADPPRDARVPAPPRLRVTRTTRLVLGELPGDERRDLCRRAYEIYASFKKGVDRATFEAAFFADDAARVALFDGEDGGFAGFAVASLHRVAHQGEEHAVYSALLFIDARYKGTREASLFALKEALRFKLREPWTPLAYLGVATSPASYRMFSVTMPTFYPTRQGPAPPQIDAVVRAAARARGLSVAAEGPWLVRGLGTPRHPARLRRAKTLRDDPDARFYLAQNPGFDDGSGLLLWVPLTLGNISGALARRLFGNER